MDSSKKVTEFKKILSTITEPQLQNADDKKGKSLPFSSSKSLSLGPAGRGAFSSLPLSSRSPSNLTVAHKLDFSDDSALLNNSTSMEITACSPAIVAGTKRKSDEHRLLMEGELTTAQGKMTSLSNQLEAERNMKKRLKIEQEKEIRDFKAEKIGFETKIRDLLEKCRRVEEAKRDAEQTASAVAAKSLTEKSCLEAEKRELEMTVQQLKTDAQEMKHALDHANGDIDKLNDSAEMAKEDMDLQMEEMQQAAEHDRDRIDRLLEEVESLRDSRNFAVDAEGQILDLNNKVRLLEEEAKLGKLFKEQSEEVRQLQLANDELSERNRILSTTQEDTSVLQEKLRSANAKIQRTEDRLQDMTRMNLEITKLRSCVAEWECVLSEVLPEAAPSSFGQGQTLKRPTTDSLREYLAKSQHDLLYASEQRQNIELELGSAHDLERRLREELDAVNAAQQKEQQKVKQLTETLVKLRKKFQLVSKERDSYRSVLNSYESEMTVNPADVNRKQLEDLEEILVLYRREVDREFQAVPNLGKALPTPQPTSTVVEVTAEMPPSVSPEEVGSAGAPTPTDRQPTSGVVVDDIEDATGKMVEPSTDPSAGAAETDDDAAVMVVDTAMASGGDGSAAAMDAAMKAAEETEARLRKEIDDLVGKLSDVEGENARLTGANEVLEAEHERIKDLLEGQKMRGDYDPAETKVVHMRFNPVEMMKRKMLDDCKELKAENERLSTRVRLLEQSGGKDAHNLQRVVEAEKGRTSSLKQKEEMKAIVDAAELKNKRLMEAFQKTSQDYREAVFRLFGYKLDVPITKQYKLMSIYAESPTDCLLFSQSASGEMQLLANEFSDSLADLIDAYLNQADSIPAFLASVTMDLFNRQTLA